MKTDLFDDSIRRKLEAVTPAYQEKSWTQLQRFLRTRGFPPSVWQTPAQWWQPALLAATVAGVVVAGSGQYRANRALNAQIQTLSQTISRLERTQNQLQQSVTKLAQTTTTQTDTVYLTMATPAAQRPQPGTWPPPPARPGAPTPEPTPQRHEPGAAQPTAPPTPADAVGANRPPTATRPAELTRPSLTPARPANPATAPQTTPPNVPEAGHGTISAPVRLANTTARRPKPAPNQATAQPTGHQPNSPAVDPASGSGPTQLGAVWQEQQANAPAAQTPDPPTTPAQGFLARIRIEPLVALTYVTTRETEALAHNWQRHLRRVRYRSNAVAGTPPQPVTEPAAAPTQRTAPTLTWRAGAGTDLGTDQRGGGLYAEAILANRWALSTGLSLMNWTGDTYQDERMFTARTKRNFQRLYLPGGGPGPARPREAYDISRMSRAVVIPVLVSYRLPVWKRYVLSPFVGLLLSLAPRETIAFTLDQAQPRNADWQRLSIDRPLHAYSSWTLGAGLERRWGHVVGQVGPAFTLPLTGNGEAGLNTVSAGLRARLFYQF